MSIENIKVSVVIPAKNEAFTLRDIIIGCKKYASEVLVIDGNSNDGTKKIAENEGVKVFQDEGTGKGIAVKLGIEKAIGDIIVFIDADGSHDTKDIPKLIAPIVNNKADIVIASRVQGGSDEWNRNIDERLRFIGTIVVNTIVNLRWRKKFTDVQNGFRALRASAARSLDLKEEITTIEQEMVMKALKKGYRISEISSHEYARKYGSSVIVTKKVWYRYLFCLIRNIF